MTEPPITAPRRPRWRLESLVLAAFFCLTLATAVVAVGVDVTRPESVFQPLSISESYRLTNGSADTPPQIKAGQPLSFTPLVYCNNTGAPLMAHLSLTFVSVQVPPLLAVDELSAIPVTIPRGCGSSSSQAPPYQPIVPLIPGTWSASFTVSVVQNGRIEVLSRMSAPFVVMP